MDRQSTDFQSLLHEFYKQVHPEDSLEHGLKYVQLVVYRYVKAVLAGQIKHNARGLLVNHKMGVGKTILAQTLASLFERDGYKVIIIGPKALRRGFEQNLDVFEKITGVRLIKNYEYLTMKAGNLPDQLFDIIGETAGNLRLSAVFANSIVIMDEAHIYFNSVAHGREVACEVYDGLMNAKDCFIIPMTGTLIINSPFEAVPAFNLLYGKPYFPENREEFNLHFGSAELIEQNRFKLQDMVSGLMCYAEPSAADFPRELRTKVVQLPMEEDQYNEYVVARSDELEEVRKQMVKKRRPKGGRFASDEGGSSTYRVYTRMISNGLNKWKWMAEKLMSNPKRLSLYQFYFIHRGGMWDFINHLDQYDRFSEVMVDKKGKIWTRKPTESFVETELSKMGDRIYYGLYYADIDQEARNNLVDFYNHERNKHGKYCATLFLSTTGLVGLNMLRVRDVIQVSPGWQPEDWNQFKFRAIRYLSHADLPEDERTVQPTILLSVKPNVIVGESAAHALETTDEDLFRMCMVKMKNNAVFMEVLRGVSLECLAGVSDKPNMCRSCMANNQSLLTGKFGRDMQLPSSCRPVPDIKALEYLPPEELKKHGLTRVGVTDKLLYYEVYYSKNPLRLFLYENEKVVSMSIHHPIYSKLLAMLEDR